MNRLIAYSLRLGACILVFFGYLYLLRPARVALTQQVVYPLLVEGQSNGSPVPYTIQPHGVSIHISFSKKQDPADFQYRPQGGFYFLLALMILVLIKADFKWYIILGSFHLLLTLETAVLTIVSKSGWYAGFFLVNFQITYLVPAMTLAFAGWVVAVNRDLKISQG